MEHGDVCYINRSYGPFSAGTRVMILNPGWGAGYVSVKLLVRPTQEQARIYSRKGITSDGVFDIEGDYVTKQRKRY